MAIETSLADIDAAVHAATQASADWAASEADARANLLTALADALEANAAALVALANAETSLGTERLSGELTRTTFQLRGFASQVQAGAAFKFEDDAAVAGPPPTGHASLLRMRVPLGPVARSGRLAMMAFWSFI